MCRPKKDNRITIKSSKQYAFIADATNTSTLRPIERNKRFITSKQEKKGHGYGIESVKHIVNKYNGEVKFEYDNRIFAVRITMEILKEKSLWKN